MGPLIMAWLVGEGIIIYRTAKTYKAPPGPGMLLISSGVFALLALAAESDQARRPAVLFAWGIDIAAFMNLFQNVPAVKNSPTAVKSILGDIEAVAGKGTWPPAIAPNTVIIPNGTSTASTSSTTATPSTPNITGNLGASIGNLG
jgi:hypothetical protein